MSVACSCATGREDTQWTGPCPVPGVQALPAAATTAAVKRRRSLLETSTSCFVLSLLSLILSKVVRPLFFFAPLPAGGRIAGVVAMTLKRFPSAPYHRGDAIVTADWCSALGRRVCGRSAARIAPDSSCSSRSWAAVGTPVIARAPPRRGHDARRRSNAARTGRAVVRPAVVAATSSARGVSSPCRRRPDGPPSTARTGRRPPDPVRAFTVRQGVQGRQTAPAGRPGRSDCGGRRGRRGTRWAPSAKAASGAVACPFPPCPPAAV
jgi:hypothetical protein